MVSTLDSGTSDPCSGPGRATVLLGKIGYSHSAFIHPDV